MSSDRKHFNPVVLYKIAVVVKIFTHGVREGGGGDVQKGIFFRTDSDA